MIELYFYCSVLSLISMVVSGSVYTWCLLSYKAFLMNNDREKWEALGKPGIFNSGSGKTIVSLLILGNFKGEEFIKFQLRGRISIIIYLISCITFGLFLILLGRQI